MSKSLDETIEDYLTEVSSEVPADFAQEGAIHKVRAYLAALHAVCHVFRNHSRLYGDAFQNAHDIGLALARTGIRYGEEDFEQLLARETEKVKAMKREFCMRRARRPRVKTPRRKLPKLVPGGQSAPLPQDASVTLKAEVPFIVGSRDDRRS